MSDGNYIKLYRNIKEWDWYDDINTYRLFTHMLLSANWKEGNFKGIIIKRGSFVSSVKKLSEETKLSEQEIKTALKHLKSTNEITSKATNKFTVFTINNYDKWQSDNQQTNKQVTNEQPSINHQSTTIEEGKKGRRKEDNKNSSEYQKRYSADSFEMKCTNYLIASIKSEMPSATLPSSDENIDKWCDVIEKMKRIDKRSTDDIYNTLVFARKDSFWKSNIRSTSKFREKYETLYSQMISKRGQKEEPVKAKQNRFNAFPQRNYSKEDYVDIERRLLNRS